MGQYAFAKNQSFSFQAYSLEVNGVLDSALNDTLNLQASPALDGTYAVGPNGDFTTLADALNQLQTGGACGAVTFKLSADTFQGPFFIRSFNGLDSLKPLRIVGIDSVSTVLACDTRDPVLSIFNTRMPVHISHCGFLGTITSTFIIVKGAGFSDSLLINHCRFSIPDSISGAYGKTLTLSGNAPIVVGHNAFAAGSGSELELYCFNTNSRPAGISFYQNHVDSNRRNIFSTDQTLLVKHNTFHGYLAINRASKFNISHNVISNALSDGISLYHRSNWPRQKESMFYNNIVVAQNIAFRAEGIHNVNMWHNTFFSFSAYGMSLRNTDSLSIVNNIIENQAQQPALFYRNSVALNSQFNKFAHNSLANGGSSLVNENSTAYPSLDDWVQLDSILLTNLSQSPAPLDPNNYYHLMADSAFIRGIDLDIHTDIDNDKRCEVAPSIGADEAQTTNYSGAAFYAPDTVYRNQAFVVSDSLNNGVGAAHYLFVNNQLIDSGKTSFTLRIPTLGQSQIQVVSISCKGSDTSTFSLSVVPFQQAPTVRISVSDSLVNYEERVELEAIVQNGAYAQAWSIEPAWYRDDNGLRQPTFTYLASTDSSMRKAVVHFLKGGSYSICFTAENDKGTGQDCQNNILNVREEITLCNTVSSSAKFGRLYDPYGPDGDMLRPVVCEFTISSCAEEVALFFNDFNLCSDGNCRLEIFAGPDTTGAPIHNYHSRYQNGLLGDIAHPAFKDSLVVKSGTVFIRMISRASRANGRGIDLFWELRGKQSVKPLNVQWQVPESLCLETPLEIKPTSNLPVESYTWTLSNNQGTVAEYQADALFEFFFSTGQYKVEVEAANCWDTLSFMDSFTVVAPSATAKPKMAISNSTPAPFDTVLIEDVSSDNGALCSQFTRWEISPKTYSLLDGYDLEKRYVQLRFQDTGCYDIKLVTTNSFGSDSVLKQCAVSVGSKPIGMPATATSNLRVFPNPAGNHIQVSDIQGGGHYRLFSITGTLLGEGQWTENGLHIAHLPKGCYQLVLLTEKGDLRKGLFVKE